MANVVYITSLILYIPYFIVCVATARIVSTRKLLFTKLEDFHLDKVSCTCCDVLKHVLPDGTVIPCDRVAVEAAAVSLYGTKTEFERTVNQELKTAVRELLGSDLRVIPFQSLVIIVLPYSLMQAEYYGISPYSMGVSLVGLQILPGQLAIYGCLFTLVSCIARLTFRLLPHRKTYTHVLVGALGSPLVCKLYLAWDTNCNQVLSATWAGSW